MAAAATLKVAGIFNPGEWLEKGAAEKEGRKAERQAAKDEKTFQKLRAQIIEKTCDMTEQAILESKEEMDSMGTMSAAEKFRKLKANADQAERVRRANKRNICLAGASIALTVAGFATSALAPFAAPLSLVSGYYSIKALKKSQKGNMSDEMLKRQDQKEGFDELFDMYQELNPIVQKDKDMLLEKKKTLSKKEFNEFMTNYIATKKEELEKPAAKTAGQDGDQTTGQDSEQRA